MGNKLKYIFVMFVYEFKDAAGSFQNSIEVQLLDDKLANAERRAKKLAGSKKRQYIYTKTIIEQIKNVVA